MVFLAAIILCFGLGILAQHALDQRRRAERSHHTSDLYEGGRYWLDALDAAPPQLIPARVRRTRAVSRRAYR